MYIRVSSLIFDRFLKKCEKKVGEITFVGDFIFAPGKQIDRIVIIKDPRILLPIKLCNKSQSQILKI